MSLPISCRRLAALAVTGAVTCGLVIQTYAQAPSEELKPTQKQKSHGARTSPNLYEDSEIRILIPSDWKVSRTDRPFAVLGTDHPGVAQFPEPGYGLLLAKNGYTLNLNNGAGQTSPIPGGRFFEVFRMPWLSDVTDIWGCGGFLLEEPQSTTGALLYFNMIFKPLDSEARKTCGIPKDLVIERRWFAGYFSTEKGGWLFDAEGANCRMKTFTLTTNAITPAELPMADDPALQKIIRETINILASIHYKRCPPANVSSPVAVRL
jgi:hypothetical protein